MPANFLFTSAIATPEVWPEKLPNPKFQLGQNVIWAYVLTHGYGKIIGLIFASQISVRATGYHYAVRLHPHSPSSSDCAVDWAFEEDLEPLETHTHLLPIEPTSDPKPHSQTNNP